MAIVTDLSGKKIKVLSKEHNKDIQNNAFELSYFWGAHGEKIFDAEYIAFSLQTLHLLRREVVFNELENQEIFFYDGDFHDVPKSKEKPVNKPDFVFGDAVVNKVTGFKYDHYCCDHPALPNMSVVFVNTDGLVEILTDNLMNEKEYTDHLESLQIYTKAANLYALHANILSCQFDSSPVRFDKLSEDSVNTWIEFAKLVDIKG